MLIIKRPEFNQLWSFNHLTDNAIYYFALSNARQLHFTRQGESDAYSMD
jgi:hypothetical protein